MRVYVKRDKSTSSSATATDTSTRQASEPIKAAFKPVEEGQDFVAEGSRASPPPNKSFDEDIIEVGMKHKDELQIWHTFRSKIPVTSVENGLGELETKKELDKGKAERTDEVDEEDSKKWLEMFKREQSKVRQMEEREVRGFQEMKGKLDAEKKELNRIVLGL